MRVLQVCHKYYPYTGGVEEHVRSVSERLAQKYEVNVATTDTSGKLPREEIVNGVRVNVFRAWAPRNAYYLSEDLRKYLIKNSDNFDVVHAHNYHAFPALYAAQAKGRNRLVFTPHYHGTGHTFLNSLLHIPYKALGKRILEKADRIICVSHHEKSLIARNFRIDEEKVVVIPNGVDLEEFKDLEKRKKDYRSILYVGRLEKYKGTAYLIRVMPKLGNNVVLEIVGKGSCKDSLVKLARKLGVDDRVKFFQDLSRNELLQKYADADVFVLLSKHEAYGISVAEALASRVPCIVANTSALKEWVDRKNSFGIDYPINLDELATLVNNVMGKDVGKLRIPDWNEITEKLVNLYEDLLNIA
jgi:glycosyltransferase involved in cell wall biosynthesis